MGRLTELFRTSARIAFAMFPQNHGFLPHQIPFLKRDLTRRRGARGAKNFNHGVQENTENWPWEAVVLIGWLIFFRYLVYVALRYKTAAPEAKGH